MMDGLRRIQRAGRCLVLKGRLTPRDIELVRGALDYGGLCLQFVADTAGEAAEALAYASARLGRRA